MVVRFARLKVLVMFIFLIVVLAAPLINCFFENENSQRIAKGSRHDPGSGGKEGRHKAACNVTNRAGRDKYVSNDGQEISEVLRRGPEHRLWVDREGGGMRGIIKEGERTVGRYAFLVEIDGFRDKLLSMEYFDEFEKDPLGFILDRLNIPRAIYNAYIDTGGKNQCRATTRAGARCKHKTDALYFRGWVNNHSGGWLCHIHNRRRGA